MEEKNNKLVGFGLSKEIGDVDNIINTISDALDGYGLVITRDDVERSNSDMNYFKIEVLK
jgi:hypothetical protein